MAIRPALIALLAEGPCHGYELKARFEERTGGAWPLNIGQVYTTLQRLERDGVVQLADTDGDAHDGDRRIYRLTPAGADEARQWYATAVLPEPLPRDEMAARVLLALDAPDVEALAVLQSQRAAAVAHVQALRRLRREREGSGRGILALVDLSLLHAEAEVRWLDLVEQRLAAAATTATGGTAR